MQINLKISGEILAAVRSHLLPQRTRNEQAGFMFAHWRFGANSSAELDFAEWSPLSPKDFAYQSPLHLELRDETRMRVIKRGHDLKCALIEFHSHPGPYPAQFSGSDFIGFREFVPHVLWRLKGRPYVAVVVAPSGFDALAWMTSVDEIIGVPVIDTGVGKHTPTGLSMAAVKEGRAWID